MRGVFIFLIKVVLTLMVLFIGSTIIELWKSYAGYSEVLGVGGIVGIIVISGMFGAWIGIWKYKPKSKEIQNDKDKTKYPEQITVSKSSRFFSLPKNVKIKIMLIGLIISTLIGFASTESLAYRGGYFLPTFIISLTIYFILAYFISAESYEGFCTLKSWVKKAIFGGGLLLSVLFGLLVSGFDFEVESLGDFLIPFSLFYIGIFIFSSVSMWIYNSYKNE